MKKSKTLEQAQVREYLLNYKRSNLPSDKTISEMFNLGATSVTRIRQQMEGEKLISKRSYGRLII